MAEVIDDDLDTGGFEQFQHLRAAWSFDDDLDVHIQVGEAPQQQPVLLAREVGQLLTTGELQPDPDDAVRPHALERVSVRRRGHIGRPAQSPVPAQLLDHVVVIEPIDADARNHPEVNAVPVQQRQVLLCRKAVLRLEPRRVAARHVHREDVGVRIDDGRFGHRG